MADLELIPLSSIPSEFVAQGKTALLPALHAIQKKFGYIPESRAAEISQLLDIPLADIYGVIEFYGMFSSRPSGEVTIQVCADPVCAHAGGDKILSSLCARLEVNPDEVSQDGRWRIEASPCLGLCERAPALLRGETPIQGAREQDIESILAGAVAGNKRARLGGSLRILTANCDEEGATSLGVYRARGGYRGLERALSISAQSVIEEVKAAGLVGRGGAAFPTGLKWEGAAQAGGEPKYVVCNADESEPGTFKDRLLLEYDPHLTLEGMIIAAYAIGAHQGYIYVRGEYPQALQAVVTAIQEARQAGLLGNDILGSGFDYDIEIRQGAGAYICGEETALFESIEGKRGFPRIKPPYPTTHGLFDRPTVINNVETLCNIPFILENGAFAYRQYGTQGSPGPKLFCVSGDVEQPGLYEAPFGISLRSLLYELAGGIRSGKRLKAVLIGGAAGAFATETDLDILLTFEDARDAGLPLGSGAVMVFDESRDLRDVLRRVAKFFSHESCGKCYPCQMGTRRQHEILERVAAGAALPGDDLRLSDVGWTMSEASLCALGQTAAIAVLSAMKLWPHLFETSGGNDSHA